MRFNLAVLTLLICPCLFKAMNAQATFKPAPIAGENTVTISDSSAPAGSLVSLFTSDKIADCKGSAAPLELAAHINRATNASGVAVLEVTGKLVAGEIVCAVVTKPDGTVDLVTGASVSGLPSSDPPSISPLPFANADLVTITRGSVAGAPTIQVFSPAKADNSCTTTATPLPLKGGSNALQPGDQTAFPLAAKLTEGSRVCAILTDAAGKTTATAIVTVRPSKVLRCEHPSERDEDSPAITDGLQYTLIGGFEQAGLSSKPSVTSPFARVFVQSGSSTFCDKKDPLHPKPLQGGLHLKPEEGRMWGSIRLLGAPNQNDTQGVFSVFANPTGAITSQSLSSVGNAIDFTIGAALRYAHSEESDSSFDLIVGFGGTTPLQSDTVTQAFTVPAYGTAECNILYGKFKQDFTSLMIAKSLDGKAAGTSGTTVTNACLLNQNAQTTNGVTANSPIITTLGFSSQDRTSFFLKDIIGVRFNHTVKSSNVGGKLCSDSTINCYLGTLDFTFGNDAAITGGTINIKRWIFKADALYPIIATNRTTVYVFGSFSTRLARNQTDNSPLVLQAATLSALTGTGSTAVPNINTVVLPLRQPDRDFYRIGVGIDILSLFTSTKTK